MNKISRYFRGVGEEARRIRWPNRKILWTAVGVVLVIAIVSALVTWGSDWLAIQINRAFQIAFPSASNAADADSSASAEAVAALVHIISGGTL